MTGHQDNPGTGKTLLGAETTMVEIEPLVRACGVKHVTRLVGLDVKAIERTVKEYLKLDDPAVLIVQEPCVLLPEERKKWQPLEVIAEKCNGCTLCFRIGCPAIHKSEQLDEKTGRPLAWIDPLMCTGCEVCAQICPRDAIPFKAVHEL
jgi:indolepyruvate ferredoxin oxidoreductase alpha subunit